MSIINVDGLPDGVTHRDIVLITYYNRCYNDTPCWEVYAHEKEDVNYKMATFRLKSDAIEYAHNCLPMTIPVVHAAGREDYLPLVEKLSD